VTISLRAKELAIETPYTAQSIQITLEELTSDPRVDEALAVDMIRLAARHWWSLPELLRVFRVARA